MHGLLCHTSFWQRKQEDASCNWGWGLNSFEGTMDEELVARLEQEAADADSLDGSPLHEDGQLLRLAAQEIRRLDRDRKSVV